jgi:ferredoxin
MAKVNKKKCIGCGLCVSIAPETFFMDDDGKAKAKTTGTQRKLKKR